jgi:hypothetical protein
MPERATVGGSRKVMARNASGYRHDHRVLRRKRGEFAFCLDTAVWAAPGHCMECWAAKFRCPCCGPCVDGMVMTTKCCLLCRMRLVADLPPVCRYHKI